MSPCLLPPLAWLPLLRKNATFIDVFRFSDLFPYHVVTQFFLETFTMGGKKVGGATDAAHVQDVDGEVLCAP